MKKVKKGEYGYIAYQRKIVLIWTLLLFAISAAVFITGLVITGTRKNLFTIAAVLGCLPACKSVVNLIMFVRAKGCSQKAYETICDVHDPDTDHEVLKSADAFDLYMTSYEKNYALSHVKVCKNTVTGLMEDADQSLANECEKHIKEHLAMDGFKDITVKIFTDIDKYRDRLIKISENKSESGYDPESVLGTLLAISL